jgi:hypothetical protein
MSGPWENYQTGPWTQYAEPVKQEPPKDGGFFSNVGDLLVEGGKRAIGAAQISPSVISGDVGEDQAKVLAEQLAMKPSVQPKELIEAQTAFKDEAEAFEKADGFIESVGPFADFLLEFGKQVLTNPKGAVYLTAQSAANMAPQIAGMIAGGKAGAVVGSVGGPGGSAIGAGVGAVGGGFAAGVPLEIGSEFIGRISQELSERGLPPTEENITALLRDKTVVDKAISDARTKGVTTAAIDSLMTVGAGKFASGARRSAIDAARKEMGVAADAAKIAARADAILKTRTLGQKGARVAGAVGIETAGGGISEAAGQAAAYGEVDLEDVGAEMLGELGGSALSVPAAAYSTTQDLLRSKARKDAAAIIADEEKSRVPPVVDQESPPITPVEEDEVLTPTARYDDVDGVEQTGELTPPAKVADPAVVDNLNDRIEPVFLPGFTGTTTIERDGKTTTTNRTVAETAQQKFERLSRQSGKMANAYRDKILTSQEYDKFRADLDAARQAASEETQGELSPAKQEILDIANKLEAAGVKGVPDGMRNAAQLNAREPDAQSMEFYRSKLKPYEKKQDAVETESYGLPEFFSSDKKESARISDLLKSGPLKTRIALGEANAMIQRLAQTIQAAGFDVRDLVQGQVPDGIMNIKRQISNVAARAGRLANSAEAVQKKYKRANPERVKADIAGLMSDVNEAGNLIDEDQTLPLMAEEMAGVPAPVSPEVEDLLTKQRLASEDIAILSKRTRGTSLMGVLQGSLNDGEMSELAGKDRRVGKNPFISLVAKKGSRGLPMEDMVDLGRLDLFLPIQMRPGQPNYDNAESAEYIRESLRAGDFYTNDTRNEIAQIQSGIWDIQKQIDEELSLDEINREIQYAADEQRELDQEASSTATDGAFEAPEDSASTKAEEGLTESSVDEAADNQEQGEPQDFLKSQTEQEIREKQAEIDRLNKENERLSLEAERKAKADEQVGDFVLTGSSRDVDEAEARGQEPMFSSQTGTGYNISAEDQRIESELTGKSMIQVADWAVANAPNAFARVIAEKVRNRLLAFQRKGMTLDFVIEGGSSRTNKLRSARGVAQFDWGNDDKGTTITVTLNGAAVMNNQGGYPPGVQYNTVLHELLHAATRSQFAFMPNTDPLRVQMTALFNAVAERFNADAKAGKLPPVMERYYKRMNNVLQDTDEILAWGLTDKEVQAYLDDIKVGEKSVFTELVELIRKALGLGKPYESALERLVRTSESMLDVDVDAIDAMLGKKDKQIGAKGKPSAPAVQDSLFQEDGVPAKAPPINSAAFKNWFGDSKVVDENGEPLVMYHGSPERDFNIFDVEKINENDPDGLFNGFFFTSNFERADSAGRTPYARPNASDPQTRAFYLSLKNPASKAVATRVANELGYTWPEKYPEARSLQDATRFELQARGYDGIIFEPYVTPSREAFERDGRVKLGKDASELVLNKDGYVDLYERGELITDYRNFDEAMDYLKHGIFIAFDSTQIKSATDNIGTYDPTNPDIRYQREAELEVGQPKPSRQNIFGEPVLGTWSITVDPKMEIQDGLIYKMLDKNVDVKRIIEAVKETGKEIASKWNPYLQEELYHGRTATASKDFQNDEWLPLLKDMQEKDVTVGELEKYLLNRHAEAYNNFVAKRNPTRPEMQDGGSSVTTENAQKYLAGLSENQKQKFEALAKRVDAITKGTRKLLADTGYEKAETIDAWEETFPNYVPLMREEMGFDYNFGSFGTGRGFDVRRDFSRSAMGSKRNVVDIISNVISARNNAISLTEKNRVAQAVYGLALEAPNPDFWMAINPEAEKIPQDALDELLSMGLDDEAVNFLMKEPKQRVLDPKKNEVMSRINTKLRENDYVLATRVNGERRYVFFNQQDPRAERAARALKNLDAQDLGTAMGIIAKVTRWMAAVNTQYNPIFGPYNFLRDAQAAALQLSTTELAGQQAEVSKEIIPSLRVIYLSLRKSRKGKKVDGDLAKLWKEFQQEGGQTGFKDNFSRTQDRSEALVNEMEKLSEGKAKAGARAVFDWLSDYNDSLENAVRLAAYKVAKKKFAGEGFSDSEAKQKAASLAKNLTVNFNRKGDVAIQMGALYAFFNAAMQGSARMIETLRGPTGKKIMAGGLMLGSMQALLLAGAGFDDEDPPEFVRAKNIIIPTGGGDYIAIPMPLGYHVIPGVSRILTEWAISGFDDTARRTTDLFGLFLDAFNPIGNSGWSVQTVTPTVLDPFVALGENKDFTGKPISRNDLFSLRPTPGYTRAREGANWFSMQLSEFLNFASGGTKYQKGMFSPTPEQIEYLAGQAFGGIGRESMKLATTIEKTITGEELPIYKIPLYGRFVGETKGSAAESSRFYKNIERLNGMDLEIKGRRENREPTRDFMLDNPEARLLPMANKTYKAIQALRKRRTQLLERNASREAVQRVEAAITKRMKILNDRVKSIKDK